MQKERKKKISKLKLILEFGSPVRKVLLEKLTELPDYIKALDRGLRFFTEEQLGQIEAKYEDGLTWEEIETVMANQGTSLKQATFRKYIQDGVIPKAIGYKSRVAIYDKKIIRNLNFVNFFYKETDAPIIDFMISLVSNMTISGYEAVESKLDEYSRPLYLEIIDEITGISGNATDAIHNALPASDDKAKALKMLNKITDNYNRIISPDVDELCKHLKSMNVFISQIPSERDKDKEEALS